jgi:hypothetical protein
MAEYGRSGAALAARLERGELIVFPACPFGLPEGDDHNFLLQQQLGGRHHKNISYDPRTHRAAGFRHESADQAARLRQLLAAFSDSASAWLAKVLPEYAKSWKLDRASFRPEEEATRQLRLTARNDLLHVDAFPTRPTNGARLLRLFANINPDEPRIWATSDTFPELLARFGAEVGLPNASSQNWLQRTGRDLLRLFHSTKSERSEYDAFMLRLHDFLKRNDDFQEKARRRYWTFPAGSAWLLMADGLSHAALRGRFALEHSFFISREALALPQEAPAALLENACSAPILGRAA